MQKTPRILVLGATGKVGRLLRGVPGVGLGNETIWHSRNGEQSDWAWDILNEEPKPVDFDSILHLVGGRAGSVQEEIEIAQKIRALANGRTLIHASSQAVYGPSDGPLTEQSPTNPRSNYGRAKLAAEGVFLTCDTAVSLRIGNVAGADMLFKAMATGPVDLDQFADGNGPRRSYVGPSTLARIVLAVCDRVSKGSDPIPVLNCANPGTVAMSDLLHTASARWDWRIAQDGAIPSVQLETSQLQQIVQLDTVDAASLVAEARASGWGTFQ